MKPLAIGKPLVPASVVLALALVGGAATACSKPHETIADAGVASATTAQVTADAARLAAERENRSSRWSVAHALATGPKCAVDEVVHRVRGRPRATDATCPDSPAKLDVVPGSSPQSSALFYYDRFPADDDELSRRRYAGFVFEGDLNEGFAKTAPDCHYVGCTKIHVAAKGVPTVGSESCVGPLTGGTSTPAAEAPACPAAVQIAGAYRPFTRTRELDVHGDGGVAACCYAVPPPTPPSLP